MDANLISEILGRTTAEKQVESFKLTDVGTLSPFDLPIPTLYNLTWEFLMNITAPQYSVSFASFRFCGILEFSYMSMLVWGSQPA